MKKKVANFFKEIKTARGDNSKKMAFKIGLPLAYIYDPVKCPLSICRALIDNYNLTPAEEKKLRKLLLPYVAKVDLYNLTAKQRTIIIGMVLDFEAENRGDKNE